VHGLEPSALARRPAPSRWSVAEHVEHLCLTTEAYLPLIASAADALRARGERAQGALRADLMGRFLLWMVEPPVRKRVRTSDRFVPGPATDAARDATGDDRPGHAGHRLAGRSRAGAGYTPPVFDPGSRS
jgi:hypothetical protein